ncbi:hypothetical protein LP419_33370 [Massilia sp. H-1]|nr:hypothetical protein LP419_33370 [Massilia sp. H-1]
MSTGKPEFDVLVVGSGFSLACAPRSSCARRASAIFSSSRKNAKRAAPGGPTAIPAARSTCPATCTLFIRPERGLDARLRAPGRAAGLYPPRHARLRHRPAPARGDRLRGRRFCRGGRLLARADQRRRTDGPLHRRRHRRAEPAVGAGPALPGLADFGGKVFHSSAWDHGFDLRGKRVAVVGTGASAIQFVPEIVDSVAQLDLYQRTAPWILPRPDRAITGVEQWLLARVLRPCSGCTAPSSIPSTNRALLYVHVLKPCCAPRNGWRCATCTSRSPIRHCGAS